MRRWLKPRLRQCKRLTYVGKNAAVHSMVNDKIIPTAPSRVHLQGAQARHTKPILQKRLSCSNAYVTHPATVDIQQKFEVTLFGCTLSSHIKTYHNQTKKQRRKSIIEPIIGHLKYNSCMI
jgi:hypothetical protein